MKRFFLRNSMWFTSLALLYNVGNWKLLVAGVLLTLVASHDFDTRLLLEAQKQDGDD